MNNTETSQNGNGDNQFDFVINPTLHHNTIEATPGGYLDIIFVVRNVSGRVVRAEAMPRLLRDPDETDVDQHRPSLILQEPSGWVFEHTGVHAYTVRLLVPSDVRPDTYKFQLLMVGIEKPDVEIVESGLVSVNVSIPQGKVLPFVLGALAVLVAAIILVAGLAVVLLPKQGVQVDLKKTPSQIVVGEPAQYEIQVLNRRGEALNRVILNYDFPAGIIAVSAYVPNSPVRNCDKSGRTLRCDLGRIEPGSFATVLLEITPGPLNQVAPSTQIPGPLDQALGITPTASQRVEENTLVQTINVNSLVEDQWSTTTVNLPKQVVNPPSETQPFSVVIDPSSKTGLVNEPMAINVWAWNNNASTTPIRFTYKLPKGMRFVKPVPEVCAQLEDDYFILDCEPVSKTGVTSLVIPVFPVEVSPGGFDHILDAEDKDGAILERKVTTPVVFPALIFNGINQWAELGYHSAPKTFTSELWVQPFSVEDGQAIIGAHRQFEDSVLNVFLVGYYSDTLSVNVSGVYCNLDFEKTTERFHLAVVVDNQGQDEWWVTVYKNGIPVPWQEQSAQDGGCLIPQQSQIQPKCNNCAIFIQAPPEADEQDLMVANRLDDADLMPWVLGQDWDSGGQGPKLSDFFHGALSEVRLWKTARTQDQVIASMSQRPLGTEPELEAYWRLEPVADANNQGLANLTNKPYDGARKGASWGDPVLGFGNALSFNGINDFLWSPAMSTSDLGAGVNGKVSMTLSGWIHVDGVPTRQQWLMGFVPVGLSPAAPISGIIPPDILPLNGNQASESALAQKQAADQIQQESAKTASNVQDKQNAVFKAQADLATAKTPGDQRLAQARLDRARADLDAILRQWYSDVDQAIQLQQDLETLLDSLSARLELAVEASVEEGVAAIPNSAANLEDIHSAALLAAQQVMKSNVDASVNTAWNDFQQALQAHNQLLSVTVSSNSAAIVSSQAQVDAARAKYEQALAGQRDQQGDLGLKSQLAEAMAQMVAREVSNAIVAAILPQESQAAATPAVLLATPTPVVTLDLQKVAQVRTQTKTDIKRSIKQSLLLELDNIRWRQRVGLYYNTTYIRYWLSYELAASNDRVEVRNAKTDLAAALADLDLALIDAVRSQGVLIPGNNIATLLQQAADDSQRTAIVQKLQDILKKASASFSHYLSLANQTGDTTASNTIGAGPTTTASTTATQPSDQVLAQFATATSQPLFPVGTSTPVPFSEGGSEIPNLTFTPTPTAESSATPPPQGDLQGQGSPTSGPKIWAGLILAEDGHVALVARTSSDTGWQVFRDERPVPVGQWVHYAIILAFDADTGEIDPDSLDLVRNGVYAKGTLAENYTLNVKVDQANCLAGLSIQAGFYIGGLCDTDGQFAFKGQIDEVRVWNHLLTDNDVNLWRNMPGEVYNDEIAYWPFDDILGVRPVGCQSGQACDYAVDGFHPLVVSGPMWVPADLSKLVPSTVRP